MVVATMTEREERAVNQMLISAQGIAHRRVAERMMDANYRGADIAIALGVSRQRASVVMSDIRTERRERNTDD